MFLWFTKYKKAAKTIITVGTLFLILFSYKFTVNLISAPLEKMYAQITTKSKINFEKIKYIVVLGGGIKSSENYPITTQIGESSLFRISEGIRILEMCPNARLLLSGGKTTSDKSEAEVMKSITLILGVKPEQIVTDQISLDTEQQAENIKSIIKNNSFILVTSAIHMPRAVYLFKSHGMNPIPAPTDYNCELDDNSFYYYFPTPLFLKETTSAVHEYVGFIWLELKNLFKHIN